MSYPSHVAQWLERLHGKRKVLGLIPGLGKHFSPKYDCSLHQEQSLKSLWMIGKDLRRNTLAWYTCPDRCINVWLRPEDHQLWLENFYAPSFPQMGHWNSILCSRLNLDSTMTRFMTVFTTVFMLWVCGDRQNLMYSPGPDL